MKNRLTMIFFATLLFGTAIWTLEQAFFLQTVAQAQGADTTSSEVKSASTEAVLACSSFDLVETDLGPFSLALPSDMVEEDVQGFDSYVGRYTRNEMTLSFDYGWYSTPLGGTRIVIDSRPAKINRFGPTHGGGEIYVPNTAYPVTNPPALPIVREEDEDGRMVGVPVYECCLNRLSLRIYSTQAEDKEIANCILDSLSFPIPEPGIELTKTAGDAADGDVYAIYDDYNVAFTYVVTNTGDTHLTNIVIADDMGTPDDVYDDILLVDSACAGLGGPLPPQESVTCQTTRVISDTVTTTAIASGTPTDEDGDDTALESPVDYDDAEIVIAEPSIEVSNTIIIDPVAQNNGIVSYIIANTGNVPVTDLSVSDSFGPPDDPTQIQITVVDTECAGLAELAVGETLTCTVHVNMQEGIAVTLGSVNCDNQVDITDAMFIMQYRAGLRSDRSSCTPLTANSLYAASGDVNADGKTDVRDVVIIFECVMGISNSFCPNVDPDAANQLDVEAAALVAAVKQMLIDEGALEQPTNTVHLHLPFVVK